MHRPTIKQGKKRPTALPGPKLGKSVAPRTKSKKASPELTEARSGVAKFETEVRVLRQMQEDWKENHPEAAQALEDLKGQQDLVGDIVKKTKTLVAKAKMTVGDFKAQRKYKDAHYDSEKIMQMLAADDDAGEVIDAFLEGGIVTDIALDRDATVAWFAQHPDFAERFNEAWVKEVEMTTAVTVPKY